MAHKVVPEKAPGASGVGECHRSLSLRSPPHTLLPDTSGLSLFF